MVHQSLPPVDSLSLRQAIAQMLVVRASGHYFDHERPYPNWEVNQATLKRLVKAEIGGVILLGGSAAEVATKTQQLQDWARVPLLISADIEEGVGQRFSGATEFPPPMALGEIWQQDPSQAIALATTMGKITAQEALAIGLNWVLAPVLDINNNPNNPVINVRAFGETSEQVSTLGCAYIQGAQESPVLTTAKHFPGHGDTATDSHLALPTIEQPADRLQAIELQPFREAIAAGVDTVMVAHLLIPSWDQTKPTTLSNKILTGQLRQNLQFEGLIVTDALVMGGITTFASPEIVAVDAIKAGADILLMPPDVDVAIDAVVCAVENGNLTEARIRESVSRIFQAKQKILPISKPTFPIGLQGDQPRTIEDIEEILRDSSQGDIAQQPLKPFSPGTARNLIVVDSALKKNTVLRPNCPAIAIPQRHGYQPQIIELPTLAELTPPPVPTLIQFFLRGNPFTSALADPMVQLQTLAIQVPLQACLFYGSPYYIPALKEALPNLPWRFSYGQMAIAQRLVCESLWLQNASQVSIAKEFI